MLETTRVLCELAKQSPLNQRSLSARTGLDATSTLRHCRQLEALRFASGENVRRGSQDVPQYSITLMGRIQLIALDVHYTGPTGVNRLEVLKQVVAQFPSAPEHPLQRFGKRVLMELAKRKHLLDILLKWNDTTAKLLLREGLEQVWDNSWYDVIARLNEGETRRYLAIINYGLPTADRDERFEVALLLHRLDALNPNRFRKMISDAELTAISVLLLKFQETLRI